MEINATNYNELLTAVRVFTGSKIKKCYLPENPAKEDLIPYLYGQMRTKRLKKKFLKNPGRYRMMLPYAVYTEYLGKILVQPLIQNTSNSGKWENLGQVMAEGIRQRIEATCGPNREVTTLKNFILQGIEKYD
jgi:hypothetical protein